MGVEHLSLIEIMRDRRLASAWLLQRAGKQVETVVSGYSMAPTLTPGMRLRIDSVEKATAIGDVVCFIANDSLICHRVVYNGRFRRAKEYIITRGDGTWLCDPPAERITVLGRVVEIVDTRQPIPPSPIYSLSRRIVAGFILRCTVILLEINVSLSQQVLSFTNRMLLPFIFAKRH